jgi:hypothetical protein
MSRNSKHDNWSPSDSVHVAMLPMLANQQDIESSGFERGVIRFYLAESGSSS